MAACRSWSFGKVAIARLTAISSYVMTESVVRHSWSSSEVAISSPSRSNYGRDLITTGGMPSDKARLAIATSQSRQRPERALLQATTDKRPAVARSQPAYERCSGPFICCSAPPHMFPR
ncbi:hypothetical protein TIFTF001_009094 [Ficus carica]|uniref:Uncharacterized protein n=1 Tax=Ficus carica TaxID=3494 RepID=A0AA87ZMJ3_FICCA|nr:hypothetical protein TIFTF001_009094 [Ficus carica]